VFYVFLLFSAVGSEAAKPARSAVPVVNDKKNKVGAKPAKNKCKQHVQRRLLHPHWNWNKKNPYAKQHRLSHR